MKDYTVMVKMDNGRVRYVNVCACGKNEAKEEALLIVNWNGQVVRVFV